MLSIQKHILLLSDFHYREFSEYLMNTNANLSYQLVSVIRKQKTQPDSDTLCALVYGDAQEKTRKKFLQLTHHTFKLTSYLSRNYPNYLKHNLQIIEEELSKGNKQKANNIADWLCDIAEKIEDFTTLIDVYKFLAQQAFISESKDTAKFHQKINEYLQLEEIKNNIYCYLRENLFFKGKESVAKSTKINEVSFFEQYVNHKQQSINILARFAKFYEMSFKNNPDFYKPKTLLELDELEKDFLNNAFVVFHYLDDIYFKILAQRLQHNLSNSDTEAILLETKKMNTISSFLKYWKSYVNIPELFSLAVQTSHYITVYGDVYKNDYHKNLPKEIKENLHYIKHKLELELAKNIWDDDNLIKLINVKGLFAAILLTGDDKDKRKSIKTLEDTLVSYQQIPFQKFLDGIFVTLIIGYFCLEEFDKVISTYKRYKKITTDQIVHFENDLTIDSYYYVAQYRSNSRKQYVEKLVSVFNKAEKNDQIRLLIKELTSYYKIPIALD